MENLDFLGNHFLGAEFSISSSLTLIGVFIFVFTFRKKIFFFIYKETDMELFLKQLDEKLKTTYPKIKFDFKYLDKIKDEPNPDAKKYALIDNIINQYEALEFTAKYSTKSISPLLISCSITGVTLGTGPFGSLEYLTPIKKSLYFS